MPTFGIRKESIYALYGSSESEGIRIGVCK
jgi:hypothetical protein